MFDNHEAVMKALKDSGHKQFSLEEIQGAMQKVWEAGAQQFEQSEHPQAVPDELER